MRRFVGICLCATVACAMPSDRTESPEADTGTRQIADLSSETSGLFRTYDVGRRPGYAIAVIEDGNIAFAEGFGLANIGQGQPISPSTSFNIASLSKQFTAAAVALELEKGTLSLDDRLAMYWPDLPEFMAEITIAHLVYMTSGLKEYYTLPSPVGGWASEDQFTVDDAIETVFSSGELAFAPGTQWSYSNINYQILAELIATLNETTFPNYMSEMFFEPLGMKSTWVDAPIAYNRLNKAVAYNWSDEIDGWAERPRQSPHYGGSGIYSSLDDLAKWDRALYSEKFYGESFTETMLSTRIFDHGKDNDAFGLVHGSYRGVETIWYEGGDDGVSAYMIRVPQEGQTIICLANFGDAYCAGKSRAVLDVLLANRPRN